MASGCGGSASAGPIGSAPCPDSLLWGFPTSPNTGLGLRPLIQPSWRPAASAIQSIASAPGPAVVLLRLGGTVCLPWLQTENLPGCCFLVSDPACFVLGLTFPSRQGYGLCDAVLPRRPGLSPSTHSAHFSLCRLYQERTFFLLQTWFCF